jgi:hypothetical protein
MAVTGSLLKPCCSMLALAVEARQLNKTFSLAKILIGAQHGCF